MFTDLFSIAEAGGRRSRIRRAREAAAALAGSPLARALTAPHGVDRYVQFLDPSFSLDRPRAEIVGTRRQTPDSLTLTLVPNGAWQGHRAGQSLSLGVEIDGVRHTRNYSPANSQHADGEIELTIRTHPHGLVSRHLAAHARPGMILDLGAAAGDFVIAPEHRRRALLLIGGGSGITPVISMLRTLCDEGHTGPVTFVQYARDARHALYRPQLQRIAARHRNVTVREVLTREGTRPSHLTATRLRQLCPGHLDEAAAFVCGPPGLIEATRRVYGRADRAEAVHSESFLPVRIAPRAQDAGGRVALLASGRELISDGATLLEQAEHAGLAPAHGCRMGICHTCTCTKVSGRVRNVHTGAVSSDGQERIQICVSVPQGDVELDL